MLHVSNDKVYVATYKEIVLMMFVFGIVLIILYPKDILMQQVLKENSNYDLSITYLQNMLKQDPKNEQLMYMFAQKSLDAGKRDLSYRLLQTLLNSQDPKIKQEANVLAYKLAKEDYNFVHDASRKAEIKDDLKKIFTSVVKNRYYTKDTIDQFYKESQFLGANEGSYILLQEKIKDHPKNIAMITDAYNLAVLLKKSSDAESYLDLLKTNDTQHKDKWSMQQYNYYIANKEMSKAEEILKNNAKDSLMWKQMLAKFYLSTNNYPQASQTFSELFESSNNIKDKKEYFMQTLQAMQAEKNLQAANQFANKNQHIFLNDSSMRVYLLKFYLSINNPKSAAELSQSILKNQAQ
jgi:predicted Zn-dependent protease